MSCAKQSQFHNWLFVVALLHFGVAPVSKSKLLFEEPPQNSLFAHILPGKSRCIHELCTLEKIVGVKPLPKNLLFQMDNYMKDKKNWHFFNC
jgi:hypothetical protein